MIGPKLPSLPAISSATGIPPRLHRIWVGPSDEVPEWVQASWRRWDQFLEDSAFEWQTFEWTNQSVRGTPLYRAVEVASYYGLPPRGLADLIRVIAVSMYGGFYVDADVVPLRSLDDLVLQHGTALWTCSHAESREQGVLWNGGFGAEPGHPYFADIMYNAQRGLLRGVKNEHFLAGPRIYREALPEDEYTVTEWNFQFEASREERRTMGAGGDFDYEALRAKYPARLKHIGPVFQEAS